MTSKYALACQLIREADMIRTLERAGRPIPEHQRLGHNRTRKEFDRAVRWTAPAR